MTLTVFTPTYNRENTLPRLYESLKRQTNNNFEWLIVDDGSVDETKALVETWEKENKIKIRYIFQQNAGKMQAHNTGVLNTKTELFVCVDSDDYLVDNAVETILSSAQDIFEHENIAGIIAGKGENDSKLLGSEFPAGINNSSLNDLYRSGFSGDTTLVFKSSVLKNYLFPRFSNEKFITEDYVYCQIDEKYTYKILPIVITVCEYLNGGYTNSAIKLVLNNPIGANEYYNLKIKLSKSFKEKSMFVVRYIGFGKLTGMKSLFKKCNSKLFYIMLFPIGFVYYLKKKKLRMG